MRPLFRDADGFLSSRTQIRVLQGAIPNALSTKA